MPKKKSNFVSKKTTNTDQQFQSSKRREEFASDFQLDSEQKQLYEQDFGTVDLKGNDRTVSERTAWN